MTDSLPETENLISLVIPVLDERESLETLYGMIVEAADGLGREIEIIFVDDGSRDGSFEKMKALHEKDPRVKCIRFKGNFGKSSALSAGFKMARGNIVITLDGDLQDDPAEIPHFLEELDKGFDLVSGWKKKRQDPLTKTVPSKIFNWVTALLTGVKIHDFNCGIKAYRKEVLDQIDLYGELHRFIPALAAWRRFRVGEIPVLHHPRKYGRSKYGARRFLAGMFDLITVLFITKFHKKPSHLFGGAGFLMMLAGFCINLRIVFLKLKFGNIQGRMPLLFLGMLLMIVGIQFVSTGLIAEMLTFFHKQQEKEYSIAETIS